MWSIAVQIFITAVKEHQHCDIYDKKIYTSQVKMLYLHNFNKFSLINYYIRWLNQPIITCYSSSSFVSYWLRWKFFELTGFINCCGIALNVLHHFYANTDYNLRKCVNQLSVNWIINNVVNVSELNNVINITPKVKYPISN